MATAISQVCAGIDAHFKSEQHTGDTCRIGWCELLNSAKRKQLQEEIERLLPLRVDK